MKKVNAITLLIIAIIVMIIGGGLYWAQTTGRISLFAAFTGWPDVSSTDPAYTELMAVGQRGWMLGFADGTFKPDQAATRAEVVIGEVRARGDKLVTDSTCSLQDPSTWPFNDVPCDNGAYSYILTAKNAGIIDGYPDGSFKPDQAATRAELTVFIVKALGLDLPAAGTCTGVSTQPFPDVACDYWAWDYISAAKQAGIIYGYEDGNFRPDDTADRRTEGVLLYRAWIVENPQEVTITGVVNDATTKEGIAGAHVSFTTTNITGAKLAATADSTGAYSLSIAVAGGSYSILATATGYVSQTKTIPLDSANIHLDFSLTKNTNAERQISGKIRDAATGAAIVGAKVSVVGFEQGSQLTDVADSYGNYSLSIRATSGKFTVKAQATGYTSKNVTVTLSGSQITTLNISLAKAEVNNGNGSTPEISGSGSAVTAANTGAVLPVTLVFIGTVLALFSLIYLLRTNKTN